MKAAWEPVKNHLLVLELGGGIRIPGVPTASDMVHQVWRHTWRLSMNGQLVDAEPEDKAWVGHHVALKPVTCLDILPQALLSGLEGVAAVCKSQDTGG